MSSAPDVHHPVESYEGMMGTPMDPMDHPASEHAGGTVLPADLMHMIMSDDDGDERENPTQEQQKMRNKDVPKQRNSRSRGH